MTNEKIIILWAAIIGAIFLFIFKINDILLPFVISIIFAYLLDPIVIKLEKHLSRSSATFLIISLFFIILAIFFMLIVPIISEQISEFILKMPLYKEYIYKKISSYSDNVISKIDANYLNKINDKLETASNNIPNFLFGIIKNLWSSSKVILNLISLIFITPIITFYLLKDFDKIRRRFFQLLPRSSYNIVKNILEDVDRNLSAYIHGQVNVCLILAAYYSIALSTLQLEFGFGIGFITGILCIIPYGGFLLGLATTTVISYFEWGLSVKMSLVIIVMIIGNLVESNYLTPKLIGEKVGLHPVWMIFAMYVGGSLMGFTGVLIALPVASIIGVLIKYLIEQYLNSELYR